MIWTSKHPSLDRSTLMEEDGFELIAQPGEYWQSWIEHKDCPGEQALPAGAPWRWVNLFEGKCKYCPALIPEGISGAWILHNYENYTKALRIRAGLRNPQ